MNEDFLFLLRTGCQIVQRMPAHESRLEVRVITPPGDVVCTALLLLNEEIPADEWAMGNFWFSVKSTSQRNFGYFMLMPMYGHPPILHHTSIMNEHLLALMQMGCTVTQHLSDNGTKLQIKVFHVSLALNEKADVSLIFTEESNFLDAVWKELRDRAEAVAHTKARAKQPIPRFTY